MKEISDDREEIDGGSYSRMGREQIKREEEKERVWESGDGRGEY